MFCFFPISPSQHSALHVLFSYNRVYGFLLFLFIICPGKADNYLAVISGVINLDDDNRRKTCAVCEAGGTLLQHHMHHSCNALTLLCYEMYLRVCPAGCLVQIYTFIHCFNCIHYATWDWQASYNMQIFHHLLDTTEGFTFYPIWLKLAKHSSQKSHTDKHLKWVFMYKVICVESPSGPTALVYLCLCHMNMLLQGASCW